MRTTAAIIDRTLTSDCGTRHNLGREMGDALLRYRPVFYRSAFRYLGNAAGQEICIKNLETLNLPRYSRRRSRKRFRRSDGGTQIA